MKKDDVKKLLSVMKATYPQFYKNMTFEESEDLLNVWSIVFAQDDYKHVEVALMLYIREETKGFPPTPGQILSYITATQETNKGLNIDEAWKMVDRVMANLDNTKLYNELPDEVKKALPSHNDLQQYRYATVTDIQTIFKRRFEKEYEANYKRQEARNKFVNQLRIESK